jgi:S-DNA-T family DNA segregation ATPase FtsK/SpoIIIE
MVATGMTDELFEIVRTFFVEVDDDRGWDAAADVIARAMAQLKPGTPVAGARPARELETARDLLEDVAEVLGDEEKVKVTDVVARLRQLAPDHRPYRAGVLNGDKLAAQLGELGVKVTKVGVLTVFTERVRKALAERAADA